MSIDSAKPTGAANGAAGGECQRGAIPFLRYWIWGYPPNFLKNCDAFFCNRVYNLQQNLVLERLKIDLLFFSNAQQDSFHPFQSCVLCNIVQTKNIMYICHGFFLTLNIFSREVGRPSSKPLYLFFHQIWWNQVNSEILASGFRNLKIWGWQL